MSKITKITLQKRNKGRYNIFLDRGQGEEYAFSVDEDVLIKYQLKKGLELDEEYLKTLIEEDEKKKTYHLALNYLSYRMRSIDEIKKYLLKKERVEEHIDEVIQTLIEQKLLDDHEFARAFVQTKRLTQVKGPLKLKQELMQKGVSKTDIEEVIQTIPKEEQINEARKWLEKQANKSTKHSNRAYKDKLAIQLQSKGYSHSIINEALHHVEIEKEGDDEWEALCYQAEKVEKKYQGKYERWEYVQRFKQALYRKGFAAELIERYIDQKL
ncbi:recombination regulator RecX [Bacillus suaedae]|uniref:Regulatory protein RecX n=1 Tax=Halalkalibacter suaedae TaxID=2822140 RepID=A0A940WTB5_9BACI|nr:recombination regulator RecX [Bacillus suaedae]MBP3952369.1 recombination regulator RecX [Bacillus suaedae]